MKLTVQNIKNAAGFTLIELLVVIAIIGILAAALIATIDPLEQIKKSSDATTKNVAVEYLNASTRYYATHQAFPWDTTANGGGGCTVPGNAGATKISDLTSCTTLLTNEKELKSGFTSSQALPKILLNYNATDQSMIVCFKPTSKSQLSEAKYTAAGLDNAAGQDHWCTK